MARFPLGYFCKIILDFVKWAMEINNIKNPHILGKYFEKL